MAGMSLPDSGTSRSLEQPFRLLSTVNGKTKSNYVQCFEACGQVDPKADLN